MKRNKGIVLVSTIVVVLLGLFLGLKFINKPGNKVEGNAKDITVAGENKKKEEDKDNFLSQSLREEKESKEKEKKSKEKEKDEDRLKELEKDTLNEGKNLKEDREDKEDKDDKEESKATNGKGIEVYDDKYVVKKGDTLFSIAKQYFDKNNLNKAVSLIKEINNMDNLALIKEGDKLLIPTEDNLKEKNKQNKENIKEEKDSRDNNKEDTDNKVDSKDNKETSSKGKAYIVKKGDTLTAIAKEKMDWCKSNEAIKLLIENNDLKDANDIKENQKIFIPLEK